MNICLVSQEYPPETARGGIGTQTWNKARSLSRLGHAVHVLTCASAEGSDLRSESCSGVMVHRMQPPDQGPGEHRHDHRQQDDRADHREPVTAKAATGLPPE